MASKRRKRRKSCLNKVRHDTMPIARTVAHICRNKYSDRKIRAYKCKFCNGFHIGHPPRTARIAPR